MIAPGGIVCTASKTPTQRASWCEGRPYKDVALALNRHKKVTGAAKFNSNDNWRSYLVAEGLTYIPFPAAAGEPRMNGERFSEQHPKGRFVLRMAKHLVACVDGVILDTWDCSQKCVYGAYRVPQ